MPIGQFAMCWRTTSSTQRAPVPKPSSSAQDVGTPKAVTAVEFIQSSTCRSFALLGTTQPTSAIPLQGYGTGPAHGGVDHPVRLINAIETSQRRTANRTTT